MIVKIILPGWSSTSGTFITAEKLTRTTHRLQEKIYYKTINRVFRAGTKDEKISETQKGVIYERNDVIEI